MSRLTIDLTEQQHQTLKARAALEGKTIKQYALERLLPDGEGSDQAWQDLENLLRSRLDEALVGKVSTKRIREILDEAHKKA